MKISWGTVLDVLVAMAIWTIIDQLFLGDLLSGITHKFEQAVS